MRKRARKGAMDAGGLTGGRDLPLLWRAWRQSFWDWARGLYVEYGLQLREVGERDEVVDLKGTLGKRKLYGYGPKGLATRREVLAELPPERLLELAESLVERVPQWLLKGPDEWETEQTPSDELRRVWRKYETGVMQNLLKGDYEASAPGLRVMGGRSVGWGYAKGRKGDEGDQHLGDLLRWCLDDERLDSSMGIGELVAGLVLKGSVGRKSDAPLAAWLRAMIEMGEGWRPRKDGKGARLDGEWSARWLRHAWGIQRTGRTVRAIGRVAWGREHAAMADAIVEWFLVRGVWLPGEPGLMEDGRVINPGGRPSLFECVTFRNGANVSAKNMEQSLSRLMGAFGMRPRGHAAELARAACERRVNRWRGSQGGALAGSR